AAPPAPTASRRSVSTISRARSRRRPLRPAPPERDHRLPLGPEALDAGLVHLIEVDRVAQARIGRLHGEPIEATRPDALGPVHLHRVERIEAGLRLTRGG